MAIGRDGAALGSIGSLYDVGTSAGLDDAQLLGRFLSGRDEIAEAAFETLVIRHGPMVTGVCLATLRDAEAAQDAFQATFLVLARRAGSIRKPEALASWLFGVARKVATRAKYDAARRRLREREAGALAPSEARPGPEPEDYTALFEEIDRLPVTYRDPVVLCYLDGMTYEAAARHLGCPPGTLSVRLKRARERLRARLTRRGMGGSAGLLVAGQGHFTTSVSPSVAGALARSARAWAIGKATASGVVPAAVAELARRTIMTMRFPKFGLGVLALGGVALAATASLAMKPTAPPTEVPEARATRPARSWVKTLPGGATVELVGVSTYPAAPATWKTPDGEPLAAPPYAKSGFGIYPQAGQRAWEFAIRYGNLPNGDESRRWEVLPPGSFATGYPRDAVGDLVPGLASASICLPEARRSCTVRAGVAAGPWKTAVEQGPEPAALGRQDLSVIFGQPRDIVGKTFVTISHDEVADDVRLVAVDPQGQEHTMIRTTSSGVSNYRQVEAEFDLPLAQVKRFRLQSRPFAWAEFVDVPLDPGAK